MYGWRARIGDICPSLYSSSREWGQLLPDGVDLLVVTLGIQSLTPEEFDRVFVSYVDAAKQLATAEVDFIAISGSPILTHKGIESTKELLKRIEEDTGVKATTDLTAAMDALNRLSAKNIVLATPYEDARNEERKQLLESCGFNVLAMKGLGIQRNVDLRKLPPYASYQVARDAFREAPEADAIYVSCAAWEVVANIDMIERDLGKPMVTCIQAELWAALSALHISEPIRGYGKLLGEML